MHRLALTSVLAVLVVACTDAGTGIDEVDGGGRDGGGDGDVETGGWPVGTGDSTTASTVTCATTGALYAIASDGNLVARSLAEPAQGGAAGEPTVLGSGWTGREVFSVGHGVFYAVDAGGQMLWYRRTADGVWASGSGDVVDTDWGGPNSITSGGDGILYTLNEGELRWYRNGDTYRGNPSWVGGSGTVIATGWDYVAIIGAGDGVIYAIDNGGKLHWHRHLEPFFAGTAWAEGSGAVVGEGWDRAARIVSAGGGVLYAIRKGGAMRWYRHLDPTGGAASWQDPAGVNIGDGIADDVVAADVTACYLGAGIQPVAGAQLAYGVHPHASDALRALGISASRLTQTIGSSPNSAGTHAKDGEYDGLDYTCAVDISVTGWSETKIKDVLEKMGQLGYAGWYRKPGYDGAPTSWAPHIHAVWAAAPMKLSLRDQIRDWLRDRNGLVSHTEYQFFDWSSFANTRVRKLFLAHNPEVEP